MSQEFSYKLQRRKEREPERELLKKAKELYHVIFGAGAILYRNKLNMIKKQLIQDNKSPVKVPEDKGVESSN